MHSEATKAEALRLRCEGQLPLRDVADRTGVAVSTVSGWCGDHHLDECARTGRAKTAASARWRRRAEEMRGVAPYAPDDPEFLKGLLLYWCEGSKRDLQFCNGDPRTFAIVVPWMRKYLGCEAGCAGLDLFDEQDSEVCRAAWSRWFPGIEFKVWRKGPSKRASKCVYGMCRMSFSNGVLGHE